MVIGAGGLIVATAYTRFSAQFLESAESYKTINRIRSQMPDSVSDNMDGEIYDDVDTGLQAAPERVSVISGTGVVSVGLLQSGSVTSRLFGFGAIRNCG